MACVICYSNEAAGLPCCSEKVCDDCLTTHIRIQLQQGQSKIKCPAIRCKKDLNEFATRHVMTQSMGEKMRLLQVNANRDPTVKACPGCNLITTKTTLEVFTMRSSKGNRQKSERHCREICVKCDHAWCFLCHAPWHDGLSCQEFKKGSSDLVQLWSKKQTTSRGQRNAYPCPYCGIYIERNGGCPAMQCSRCRTSWCYQCGQQKYLFVPLFGHHEDPFSVLGCNKGAEILGGDVEVTRRVRNGIFVVQVVLIVLIAIPFLLITLPIVPILLILGTTVLVSIGIHKLLNRMKTSWDMTEY